MIVVRNVCEAKYGHFADVLRMYDELNEICRARGWKAARYLTPMGDRANLIEAEVEYESFAECEREQAAAYADPEFMKVLRSASEHVVQGSAYERLLTEAPHLA